MKIIEGLPELILASLNLNHLKVNEIQMETPLYGEGLGLDSIDILELVVNIEKKYGIKIKSAEIGREVFQTVGSLSSFIQTQQHKAS